MAPPILLLQDIAFSFGGTTLIDGAEISVSAGERLALVGRNGSGKSTLLKIAAGMVETDSGTRFVQPGATLRYLPQEPDLGGHQRVLDFVEAGLGPGDDAHRARYLLEALGLTGEETPHKLSGGEARRAALARALAPEPDILLLDEPTNHLDLPAIEWLEEALRTTRSAIVLISHDRRFLDRLSRATIWLDRGRTRRMEASFSGFEAWRDEVLAQEELDRHKLDRRIAAEEDWLRYGVTARRKRNQGRLAGLAKLREERRDARRAQGSVRLAASEADLSGRLVIEAEGVAKSYSGRPVVSSLSLRVQRGDRLGIVGPNGAGKTTLLEMLTGRRAPDEGTVKLGANLEMVTLDQMRGSLDPAWTLAEALTGGRGDSVMVGGQARHIVGYMKDFLFTPEQIRSPVSVLSGGERGRLMLARALARPSNLLVLDEPTNDLDLETLDLLQEMIADYSGTVLLVSHDRDFLDRTVTSILASEGNGRWTDYAGGYSDMLGQRRADPAAAADGGGARRKARTVPQAKPQGERRKLSFKDKHALETLPARMDALRARIEAAGAVLADPRLYASEPARFDAETRALSEAQAELDAAETRWLELEMLREELEES